MEAIFLAMDDDAPRRVYADWLLAQGDPLGELLALRLAPDVAGLAPQAQALEDALRKTWQLEEEEAVFSRGLVDEIAVTTTTLLKFRRVLGRGFAVRRVTLLGEGEVQAALVKAALVFEAMPVRDLTLSSMPISLADVALIRALPFLPRLTGLALAQLPFEREWLAALLDAPLYSLKELRLINAPLDPGSCRAIGEAEALRSLGRLAILSCELEAGSLSALCASPHLPKSMVLALAGSTLDGDPPQWLKERFKVEVVGSPED